MKITIDNKKLLADLMRRANSNRNGVRNFLAQGGVESAGDLITVAELGRLYKLNREAFNSMIMFLYPEAFGTKANGDGTKSEGSGLSSEDKQGIFSLFGNLISTAGGVLGNYASHSGDSAAADIYRTQYEMEQLQKKNRWMWAGIICGIVAVIAIVAFIATRPATHITKV